MAISTYSDLKTSVANWLHRTDLTSIVPDFVTLAEAHLNRVLGVSDMEQEDTLTATIGSALVALPSLKSNSLRLWITTYSPRDEIDYVMPQDLIYSTVNGYPTRWTISGDYIKFDKPADIAYSIAYLHTKRFALSDSVTTNWLLTKHPDLYLYATLLQAAPYLGQDPRIATWQNLHDRALQEVMDDDHVDKSMANLMTDHPSARRSMFNINRGY